MPGLVPGIHVLPPAKTWMAGHRRAEATPSFQTAIPGHYECVLDSPSPNPEKASQIAALTSRLEEIPMSLSALESTVNTAFDARDGISTATKGEVRDAVDHALELLDKGEVRVAEREAGGKWKVNQWLKKAGLLSFRLHDMTGISAGSGTQSAGAT